MEEAGGVTGGTASVSVTFSAEVFPLDAIKRAAYRFCDRAAVDIVLMEEGFHCTLRFRSPLSSDAAERLADDFRVEVLDQDLRTTVARETEAIRNAVLAYAFSKTGLQEE